MALPRAPEQEAGWLESPLRFPPSSKLPFSVVKLTWSTKGSCLDSLRIPVLLHITSSLCIRFRLVCLWVFVLSAIPYSFRTCLTLLYLLFSMTIHTSAFLQYVTTFYSLGRRYCFPIVTGSHV